MAEKKEKPKKEALAGPQPIRAVTCACLDKSTRAVAMDSVAIRIGDLKLALCRAKVKGQSDEKTSKLEAEIELLQKAQARFRGIADC
jgi:hypothetical protein